MLEQKAAQTGYTPLIHAAADGKVDVVKLLLKNKADVDTQDNVNLNSALHEASWKGYSQTIEVLCKNKANLYLKNKQGHSALHLACQQGHNQSCRILLIHGCKPDIKNNFGDTPLHSATRYGHAGVVRILLSAFCNVNEVNKNGDTALHISAAMGRKKLTRILLEAGSNPAIQNKQGETAMSICIRKSYTDVQEIIANPPPLKLPTAGQLTKSAAESKTKAKREKESSQGSKDSGEKRRQDRFKKTRSGSSRSVHFIATDGEKQKLKISGKKVFSGSCDWSPYGCHLHPDVNDFPKPKLDSLPAEPLTKGEQYYIDLAGNICKGPVGRSNKCFCKPLIHNMEKRMEKDKQELIEHIDFAHENLNEKICSLEKKTHNQLVTLNEAVHQKLAHERLECNERVQRTALKERIDSQRRQRLQLDQLKTEVKTWLGSKFSGHRRSCSEQLDQFRDNENHNQNAYQLHDSTHNHNPYYNHRKSLPLERTTSHVNVPVLVHSSHNPSDHMFRPKSSDEVLNCVNNSQKQHLESTPIARSKSEMYLTESVGTGSDDEEEDEEAVDDVDGNGNTIRTTNDNDVNDTNNHNINDNNVPNVDTSVDRNGQTVYNSVNGDSDQNFERLGARPKEPLRIQTSCDTTDGTIPISDQNSGSSAEMTAHLNNHSLNNSHSNEESDQISHDINLSADLMKTLRCNGSIANNGHPSNSPFNDSGYRTKFSPSPREVTAQALALSQHTAAPTFTHHYIRSTHQLQHQNGYQSHPQHQQHSHYGAFDPPIGLPTNPQPIHQQNIRKFQIPFHNIHNRPYNGPNSSLV